MLLQYLDQQKEEHDQGFNEQCQVMGYNLDFLRS